MSKKLPSRPDLDHLRRQAKQLLAAVRDGDAAAARELIAHLPAAAKMTPAQVLAAGFRLADAQSAVAKRSGFDSWPKLSRHVSQLRELEGTWEFATLEIDGNPVSRSMISTSRLIIDGDLFRTETPGATYESVFNIDVETDPHRIDIEFIEGPEAGKWSYGLYELSGDRLTICLGLAGATRPEGFATKPGSRHALETLVRRHGRGATSEPASDAQPATDAAFEPSAPKVLAPIAGEWKPVAVIADGAALPAMMLKAGKRVVAGNVTRVTFGLRVILDCPTRFRPDASPWELDYLHATGPGAGKVQRAIARLVDGELETCMAAPGEPRPDAFASKPGSGWTLSRWRKG